MERSFERTLVEQCAPTLEGVKPASLFRWQGTGGRTLALRWGKRLAPFQIAVRVLKTCPRTGASLIYLYRAEALRALLAEPDNRSFLRQMGYQTDTGCGGLLEQLSHRLCLEAEFPHEIGLFLGYPLEDVVGFMKNGGRNYTCSGCWKAYGDPEEAQRRFALYRDCTDRCKQRFSQGADILELISA